MAVKTSRKRSAGFAGRVHIHKTMLLTAIETDAKFLNIYVKGLPFLECRKGVRFLSKMVDIKVRGWTLGLDYPLTPGRITKQSDPLRDLRL